MTWSPARLCSKDAKLCYYTVGGRRKETSILRPGSSLTSCGHTSNIYWRLVLDEDSSFSRLNVNRFQRFLFPILCTARTTSYVDIVQVILDRRVPLSPINNAKNVVGTAEAITYTAVCTMSCGAKRNNTAVVSRRNSKLRVADIGSQRPSRPLRPLLLPCL